MTQHTLTLAPSLMCGDFQSLAEDVRRLDSAGADQFHLDVMDGVFVPNYAMGLHDVAAVRATTTKKIDCHLMVSNPDLAVKVFAKAGADIMHVHLEATPHIARVISTMKDAGVEPGVALNPGTPAQALIPILDIIDHILIMTVNPGFAGQKYLDWVDTKITTIVELRGDRDISIGVDGAISPERIRALSAMGANTFILGTSTLFGHGDYRTALDSVRNRNAHCHR
jgi:ribulose-phosphate 3-epimerase